MPIVKFILMITQILSGLAIIGLVLLQHGKGADAGAGFSGGSSNSIFGASGSANFLSRATAMLAIIFFSVTVGINWFSSYKPASNNILNQLNKKPSSISTINNASKTSHPPSVPMQKQNSTTIPN